MDRIWSVDGDVSEFSTEEDRVSDYIIQTRPKKLHIYQKTIWRLCRSTKVKSAALESPGNYLDGDN